MTLGIGFMIILAAGAILPAVAVMAALGYGMVTDPTRSRGRRREASQRGLAHLVKGKVKSKRF